MKYCKKAANVILSCILLTSCGVISAKNFDGNLVSIEIKEANAEEGRPNNIAYMLIVSSPSPLTQYRSIFLQVAAEESGCIPLEDTLVVVGGSNSVAQVELNCD